MFQRINKNAVSGAVRMEQIPLEKREGAKNQTSSRYETVAVKGRMLAMLLAVFLSLLSYRVAAQTWNISDISTTGNSVTAVLSNGTLTISGTGNMGDFDVSSEGQAPWYGSRLTIGTVVIESGVTNIGNYAFDGCSNLTSITIPEGVTIIGVRALKGCAALSTLFIPNTVTLIEGEAFAGCTALQTVKLEDGSSELILVVKNQGGYVLIPPGMVVGNPFTDCPIETLHLGRNISYYQQPFAGKATLETLTIGNTVTSINLGIFDNCSGLIDVTIEDGTAALNFELSSIDGQICFADCPVETLYLGRDLNYKYGSYYENAPFRDNAALKSVTIGSNVLTIGHYLFTNCTGLQSLSIGEAVTSVGDYAFYGCSSLATPLNIPNKLKTLGQYAFYGCRNLPSLTIPNSVTSVGINAFATCLQLKTVTIEDGTTSLNFELSSIDGQICFADCPVETLYLGRDLNYKYGSYYENAPFRDNTNLNTVTIGNQALTIDNSMFEGCTSLSSITDNATTPQTINANVFTGVDKANCTLTVPVASMSAYQAANVWKDFNIVALGLSSNANLGSLAVSGYNIAPTFSENITNYVLAVPYTTGSITISATAADNSAKSVEGIGNQTLQTGTNTCEITVIAANSSRKTYTITILRAESGDSELQPQIDELVEENSRLNATIATLNNRVAALQNDSTTLANANQALQNQNASLQSQLSECEAANPDCSSSCANLQSRVNSLVSDSIELADENQDLKADVETMKEQLSECETQNPDGDCVDLQEHLETVNSLQGQIDHLQNHVDKLQRDSTDLKAQLTACRNNLEDCQNDLENCPPTAAADLQAQSASPLQVYPNPTAIGELTVSHPDLRAGDIIEVVTTVGKRMAQFTATGSAVRINLAGLAPGTYIVRIQSLNAATKIVKQ